MTTTTTNTVLAQMKQLTWGVEIECNGLSVDRAVQVVATALGGTVEYGGKVRMSDGRVWVVMRDGSLSGGANSCEVVTPILKLADMDMFQNVMRALRTAGATVDGSCGQHVHVGIPEGVSLKAVQSVMRTAYRYEEMIIKACAVRERRLGHYTKRTPEAKVNAISRATDFSGLNRAWYGRREVTYPSKMDPSRYHGINLNSFFFRRTVEFRWFEGTTHAGEARANVTLALALVAYALSCGARLRVADPVPAKAEWMNYLLSRLCGLSGEEFKNVREHLTKRLPA